MRFRVEYLMGLAVLLAEGPADAHLGLTNPASRYGPTVLKSPPCGQAGGTRSNNVATFQAGETITVTWDEYVNHPGHYRISFDADGDDDFVDPPCLANCNTRNPTVEAYSNDAVLLDEIPDGEGGPYSVTVTLPNEPCTNCTLQVIQVMYDKPPYTLPGNEMYYQCVDLVLVAGPEPDAGAFADAAVTTDAASSVDAGTAAADAGAEPVDGASGCRCAPSPGSSGTAMVLLIAAGLGFTRRRRATAA